MTDCLAEPRLLLFFCGKGVALRAADGDAMVAVGFRPRWPELPDVRTGEFSDRSFLMGWITEERVMEGARVGVVELCRRCGETMSDVAREITRTGYYKCPKPQDPLTDTS
ncbi:unnamed protein product [Boreogadus saida]